MMTTMNVTKTIQYKEEKPMTYDSSKVNTSMMSTQ